MGCLIGAMIGGGLSWLLGYLACWVWHDIEQPYWESVLEPFKRQPRPPQRN